MRFKRAEGLLGLWLIVGIAAAQNRLDAPIDRALPIPAERQAALQAAIRSHHYDAAEALLATEAGRNPRSQALLLVLADVLFLDGKQLNTVLALKKAELLGALDERSRHVLALSYVSLGRRNLAIAEFEKLAASDPSSAVYPYWLSRLAYRKMDLRAALVYARQSVQLDSSFAKAYDQLGLCYAAMAQFDEAIQAYQQAVRLNREQSQRWPWPALNLGSLYLRLDRLDEAETALRESLAVEPNFPVAHLRLGRVLEKKNDPSGAIQQLLDAARLDPTYPEPHYALARIYKKQNEPEAARKELSTFQELRDRDKRKGIVRPD